MQSGDIFLCQTSACPQVSFHKEEEETEEKKKKTLRSIHHLQFNSHPILSILPHHLTETFAMSEGS